MYSSEKKRKRSRSRSREMDSRRKRRHSRSKSPMVRSKVDKPQKEPEVKKEAPARRAKDTDMLNTRTGGAYIPPARLRMMQAQITDKSSVAYQRLAWEALKKSIHGHINKINVGNIGIIIKELLKENIVRGRGLLCRSVIQAQAASPTFTNVYAALVAAVNSRFPNIGELLLKRLVIQFKRGFKRNDKSICISSASFIAHLVNQRVAHEILALELLTLLVETPTDDSVEVAIAFLKECGQKLTEVSSKGVNAIFEMLRNILHEGQLDKRVQYMIEVMFQVWKDGFKDHPALIEDLELVPEEEQFTHLMMLDEATDPQDILNVFKFDDKYEENEQKYKTLSKEILGSDAESGEEGSSGESGSDDDDDEEDAEDSEQKQVTIIDNTETNLVALRRTIYLTINSSLDFEECAHKLMKMQLKPGQEVELCHMFLDCCAEQRTYEKFYGLLAQRFCNINRIYIGPFEEIFKDSYATAHRLDTNRLRNVSKFFAHLLFTDSISWEVLECVKLNEEDTTSSSRIYIKILFQELAEYMGLKKLNDRLKDPTLQEAFSGLFPRDNPKNTRFSINFFTSIGLGGLTDELREHLKQMPKNVPPPITEIKLDSESSSDSSSDSSSSSSDSSSSESDSSEEEAERSKKKKSKSKKKKKNKEPTLAEEVAKEKDERWGHDGFYETYGRDAARTENRVDRRDKEDFGRSRDNRHDNRNASDRTGRREKDDDYRRDRNRSIDRDDRRNKDDNHKLDKDNRREDRRDREGDDSYRYRRGGRNDDRENDTNFGRNRSRRSEERNNSRGNGDNFRPDRSRKDQYDDQEKDDNRYEKTRREDREKDDDRNDRSKRKEDRNDDRGDDDKQERTRKKDDRNDRERDESRYNKRKEERSDDRERDDNRYDRSKRKEDREDSNKYDRTSRKEDRIDDRERDGYRYDKSKRKEGRNDERGEYDDSYEKTKRAVNNDQDRDDKRYDKRREDRNDNRERDDIRQDKSKRKENRNDDRGEYNNKYEKNRRTDGRNDDQERDDKRYDKSKRKENRNDNRDEYEKTKRADDRNEDQERDDKKYDKSKRKKDRNDDSEEEDTRYEKTRDRDRGRDDSRYDKSKKKTDKNTKEDRTDDSAQEENLKHDRNKKKEDRPRNKV